ncbi:MAG: hypothetical protein V7735_07850 [Photobacterium frigidiphilum]|uniref:hypothetical protein n=1 Tax=Photobacterium frigidiphilum TaxID=264736 RepID=UPI00300378CE
MNNSKLECDKAKGIAVPNQYWLESGVWTQAYRGSLTQTWSVSMSHEMGQVWTHYYLPYSRNITLGECMNTASRNIQRLAQALIYKKK